jgi:hypothetical protein
MVIEGRRAMSRWCYDAIVSGSLGKEQPTARVSRREEEAAPHTAGKWR